MRLGLFVAHPDVLPAGHTSYQATLLQGLLRQARHQVVVFGSDHAEAPDVDAPHELVRVAQRRQPLIGAVNVDLYAEGAVRRAVERAKVDALIVTAQFHAPRPRGVPRIAVLYEAAFLEKTPWGVYSAYSFRQALTVPQRNLDGAYAVVCLSEHGRARTERLFKVAPERLVLAPPSVLAFGAVASTSPLPGRPYVMQVGWFHPRKEVTLGLAAWRRAVESGLDVDLVLVGAEGPPDRNHGPLPRRVLDVVGHELFDRVHCPGSVPRRVLGSYYKHAQALLMTSLHEGFGLPAIEAASFGVPIVAVDRSSMPEVVGPIGTVVEPNPEAVSDALVEVCSTAPDRDALRKYAASFSVERQTAPFLDVADAIAAGATSPAAFISPSEDV
ncbi:MAG: glycosyltransferase [Acidimicrobiales bacterium]|nr:glycosyltransferase [Acidimicrobiales bacterium]